MPCSTNLQGVDVRRTRVVHVTDETTASALAKRKGEQTFRVLARELGEPRFSIATLSDVIRRKPGALTMSSEDELRKRLGLPTLSPHIVPACPSCGGAHTVADCHGQPVVAVVTLGHHERVTRKRGAPVPHTLSDYPTRLLKRLFEERQPYQGA